MPTPQNNSGALRPGLIILIGVVAIALILLTILLLPPPKIRTVAERLLPPDTLIASELNYGDLIGMSGSTERSLIDVAAFYRERLRLPGGTIVGSGISSWSQARLLGGFRSGVTMPYATEGFVILVRDKTDLQMVVASRATNENTTTIEVFCERGNKSEVARTVTRASRFIPPQGIASSSATTVLIDSAIFTSALAFTNIATHYFTNVDPPPFSSTNWTVSPAGRGMVSIPRRSEAQSATFLVRSNTTETILIHCFHSPGSTQTHVFVGCASR